MPPPSPESTLDHVAVAVERWSDAWPRYAVELGGAWSSGGLNVGFGPAQLRFANGGRVEILQPWQPEDNPFLRRFLDRHGPGPAPPHLQGARPRRRPSTRHAAAGFSPVGVDLSNDDWKEAFLHPRQATGHRRAAGPGRPRVGVTRARRVSRPTGREPPASLRARHPRRGRPRDRAWRCSRGCWAGDASAAATAPDANVGVRRPRSGRGPRPASDRALGPGRASDRPRRRSRPGWVTLLGPAAPSGLRAPRRRARRGTRRRLERSAPVSRACSRPTGRRRVVEPDDNLGTRLVLSPRPTSGAVTVRRPPGRGGRRHRPSIAWGAL